MIPSTKVFKEEIRLKKFFNPHSIFIQNQFLTAIIYPSTKVFKEKIRLKKYIKYGFIFEMELINFPRPQDRDTISK
jgi:hypothetical protein